MQLPTTSQPAAINEIYEKVTVQGEGPYIGKPCVFIRLQNCHVQCPQCFYKTTQIRMGDFTVKPISEVKEGDVVLSYDESSMTFVKKKVLRTFVNKVSEIYRIHTSLDLKTFVTGEHPILVRDKGWVKVSDLQKGDHILQCGTVELMKINNPMKDKSVAMKVGATMKRLGHSVKKHCGPERWDQVMKANSERMKANNPNHRPEIAIKGYLNRKDRGKTAFSERFVQEIGKDLGLRFVGDGSLVVNNLCPDFIVEGTKKLVEVWDAQMGEYRGRDEAWMEKRRGLLGSEGYEVLFLPVTPYDPKVNHREKVQALQDAEISRVRKALTEYVLNGLVVLKIDKVAKGKNSSFASEKSWVRLAGSLNADLDVYNFEVEDTHTYIANRMIVHNCDSFYTWTGEEKGEKLKAEDIHERLLPVLLENPGCGVVVSGGEPLLQYKNEGLVGLFDGYRLSRWCTLETSGFLTPKQDLIDHVKFVSFLSAFTHVTVSPKITPCLHGQGWADEELESNLPTIFAYFMKIKNIEHPAPMRMDLKFVCRDKEDVLAVEGFVRRHQMWFETLNPQIYIMPYGIHRDEILATCDLLIPMIAPKGWILSPRLHSLIWGPKRGV